MTFFYLVCLFLIRSVCTNGQEARQDFQSLPIMEWPKVQEPIQSKFNRTYYESVSSGHAAVFAYEQNTESGAVKVQVWSRGATIEHPILVVIKRHNSVLSWQVPLILEDSFSYHTTNRTLCPVRNHFLPDTNDEPDAPSIQIPAPTVENFFIEVLTLADHNIQFSLRVEPYPAFIMNGETSFLMEASPSAPQYVQYNMRPDSVRVLVKLEAIEGASFCGYLSLQSVRCPVGDMESELRLEGRFQTITSKSAIEVHKSHFKESKFYIVLLVHPHDDCNDAGSPFLGPFRSRPPFTGKNLNVSERKKVVRITVTDTVDSDTIAIAVAVPIIVYIVFFMLSILFLQTSFQSWLGILCKKLKWVNLPSEEKQWSLISLCDYNIRNCGARDKLLSHWKVCNYGPQQNSSPATGIEPSDPRNQTAENPQNRNIKATTLPERLDHPTESDRLMSTEGNGEPSTSGATSNMPAATTSTAGNPLPASSEQQNRVGLPVTSPPDNTEFEKQKSTAVEYGTTLIAVFVFYALPVLQLVMTHQGLLLLTGNQDLCYYNFSCSNRLGILSDFNHIISNAGYVILGILFVLKVRRRSVFTSKLEVELRKTHINIQDYGPPNQFGVLYAMGLALIMEGLMSSFYHICPSYSNFQFDTSFMYLISGLLILKLRHSRHRNILPRSYKAYAIFALFIFVAVLGVMLKQYWYWIAFSLVHVLCTVIMVLHLLFEKDKDPQPLFPRGKWRDVTWRRRVIAALIFKVNIGFAVAGPIFGGADFASHLLFILQGNLLVYAVFYMAMKWIVNEKLSLGTLIYFLLAQPAWAAGLYFFVAGLTDWKVSPAMSRVGNKECFLYNFYDEHDVWHMLSAFGLFFTFMMLLTLDDDIVHKKTFEKF